MATTQVSTSVLKDGSVTSAKLDTNIAITGDLTVDTNTLFVDSSTNRVGIGKTLLTEKLEVNGAIVWEGPLTTSKTSAGVLDRAGDDLRIRVYGATAGSGNFVVRTGGGGGSGDSEAMRIKAGGDISFRDTSNNEAFYWDASAASLGIGTTNVTSISGYTALEVNNNTNGSIIDLSQGDSMKGRLIATSASFAIETASSIDISLQAGGSEKMRITSGGDISFRDTSNNEAFYWDASTARLGIGTGSSPTNKLTVSQNYAYETSTTVHNNAHIKLQEDTASTYITNINGITYLSTAPQKGADRGALIEGNTKSATIKISGRSDGTIQFKTGSGTTGTIISETERMRIHSGGDISFRDTSANKAFYWDASTARLGIGTTSPATPIDVSSASSTIASFRATGLGANNKRLEIGSGGDRVVIKSFVDTTDAEAAIAFQTGNTERLRIDSSGVVLIKNASSPTFVLENTDTSIFTGTTIGEIRFTSDDASPINANVANIKAISANNFSTNSTGTHMAFSTCASDSQTATERMRINSSGSLLLKGTGITSLLKFDSSSYGQITSTGNTLYYDVDTQIFRSSGGTERMRITSAGYLKASNTGGYTDVSSVRHEFINNQGGNLTTLFAHSHSTNPYGNQIFFTAAAPNNTTNYFIIGKDNVANRFIVYSNGNVVNTNNSYGALSDIKLKENITDASPKLDDLMQVKIRNYNLIGEETKQIGVVAQELEEVFPAMVSESPDFENQEVPQLDGNGQEVLDENGDVIMTTEKVDLGTTTKSVKYSVFVPMLIKAMQEQQEIINDLKARIETLENK